MKRAAGIVIIVIALLGACATAPEPVQPPDEEYDTAKTLRSQIQEFELAQYARSEFDAGEEQFAAGEVAYETEEYETAGEAFNLAIDSYTIVIRDGFRAIAGARREEATAQRQLADEVRGQVALADEYNAALDVFTEAVAAEEAGEDQRAAELFENAALLFADVYQQATEKRRQALDALGRVDQRIEGLGVQREELEAEAREELETDETTEEEAE
jgi:tetratricopeptide (TPR) repeat protein